MYTFPPSMCPGSEASVYFTDPRILGNNRCITKLLVYSTPLVLF